MNLSILTCNYNTTQQVPYLLKSMVKECAELPKLVVMDTSDDIWNNLGFLPNDSIPHYNFRGGIHGEAVNLGFKKVKTRYVLLVDSDVIFLQDFKKPFEKFKETGAALMGKVVGDVAGKSLYPRVEPWYCFIDLDQLKAHKIEFFDRERMKKSKSESRVYDVGSTMFEDITNAGLTIADVSLEGKYFKHYGGMSWHVNKFNPDQPDTDVDFGGSHPNKAILEHGKRVWKSYIKETEYLDDVNINGAFSNE